MLLVLKSFLKEFWLNVTDIPHPSANIPNNDLLKEKNV